MAHWFYTDALAAQQGPVDDLTLLDLNREGLVKAKSLVWREGMAAWTHFREVAPALFSATADDGKAESGPVEIGVCAHSGRVYPQSEMLPYGEALVGPEHKGEFVRRLMEGATVEIADATDQMVQYVGFWWRTLSSLLDYLIKMIPSGLCMVPYYVAVIAEGAQPVGDADSLKGITGMSVLTMAMYGVGLLASIVLSIAYDTWMVGKYQATLGKLIIGAKVVNPDGSRLSYKRAFVRWLAKKPLNMVLVWGPSTIGFALVIAAITGLSGNIAEPGAGFVLAIISGLLVYAALLALCSGVYWMAAFDPEKRALHDRVASTRVVRK